jgi:hypothetical protein
LSQKLLPKPAATILLPVTSNVIASLNPPVGLISFVGIGPTRSQFPANGFAAGATGAGVLPPPQPQSSKPISQAVKLNQAQIFIWFKI